MRISEVRELNNEELQKELSDQERALMNLRFSMATLQLSDSNQIGGTRRTIARIRTVIRERQIVAQGGMDSRTSKAASADGGSDAQTGGSASEEEPAQKVEE